MGNGVCGRGWEEKRGGGGLHFNKGYQPLKMRHKGSFKDHGHWETIISSVVSWWCTHSTAGCTTVDHERA